MKDLFLWLIVLIGTVALLAYAGSKFNESAASKAYAQGQARAMVIEAQSQARQDLATIALPYVAIALVTVFGGAMLVLAVVIMRQGQKQETKIIETRILILPQMGSKRQMYEMLSRANEVKLLKE